MTVKTLIRLLEKADAEADVYWDGYTAVAFQEPGNVVIDTDGDVRIFCKDDDLPITKILK